MIMLKLEIYVGWVTHMYATNYMLAAMVWNSGRLLLQLDAATDTAAYNYFDQEEEDDDDSSL